MPSGEVIPFRDPVQAFQMPAAVQFHVPSAGDIWLIPDARAAEKLDLWPHDYLTPAHLTQLSTLRPGERLAVLRLMRSVCYPFQLAFEVIRRRNKNKPDLRSFDEVHPA
ncbi:MAG: hypothetical protein KatS3mg005_2061 [Bryobacteraceae bacterium]|nr:MAG: hypothetical protein KatS3mg005_2061 [Bryobacteraceae bacterium]